MRVSLDPKELPDKWYNIIPDLDFQLPPVMSPAGFPLGYTDLKQLSPGKIIEQELDRKRREISIPPEVREIYLDWRPTPLFRASELEKALGTPARIFYKYEGSSIGGGHEANTAVAQAYYAARDGARSVVTATGNGEWGASLAVACNFHKIKCRVYMVRSNYQDSLYARGIMEILGAEVIPSPGEHTRTGKKVLAEDPESPGSLGIALSEAFEYAYSQEDAKFSWGTVMNHVLLHQTIIGREARLQMRKADAFPDIIIGAVGGGSGFGGLAFPFYPDRKRIRMIAVETASAPSLTRGRYTYDRVDVGGLSVLLKMYTLGAGYVPPGIRAGGMRYHGISPIVSALYREKQIEAVTCKQKEAFEAAITFARAEGRVPSPESAYAIKAVIDEALACKQKNERKNILFILASNGNLEIEVFTDFLDGLVPDFSFRQDQSEAALRDLPAVEAG